MGSKTYQLLLVAGVFCLFASIVLLGFFLFALNSQSRVPSQMAGSSRACFASGACLELELARSNEERARGLMFRTSLASDAGMLFVFESDDTHSFWMKNTKIPLDIIWADSNGRIVEIVADAQPCTVDPCPLLGGQKDARFVVEATAGFVRQNGVRLNQKVEINGVAK